jgi:hypothetical protein
MLSDLLMVRNQDSIPPLAAKPVFVGALCCPHGGAQLKALHTLLSPSPHALLSPPH